MKRQSGEKWSFHRMLSLPSSYLSAPEAVAEPHRWEGATRAGHILELAAGVPETAEKGWTHSPWPGMFPSWGRAGTIPSPDPNLRHPLPWHHAPTAQLRCSYLL